MMRSPTTLKPRLQSPDRYIYEGIGDKWSSVSWQGARSVALLSESEPLSIGSILSKIGQLILDVRSITHDAVTDNADATFTDQMGTYKKALVISDLVFRGRGHV